MAQIKIGGYEVVYNVNNIVSVFKNDCSIGYAKVENSTLADWEACEVASKIIANPKEYNDICEDYDEVDYPEWDYEGEY